MMAGSMSNVGPSYALSSGNLLSSTRQNSAFKVCPAHMTPVDGSTSDPQNDEMLLDQILAMRKKERTTYAYDNFASFGCQPSVSGPALVSSVSQPFQPGWREQISQWCYAIIDHYDLSRDTVASTISLFDRYLATLGKGCTGDHCLLIAITILNISIKILETSGKTPLRLKTLCDLSRGLFGTKDIEDMELRVLKALGYRLHPPTPTAFVSPLVELILPESSSSPSSSSQQTPVLANKNVFGAIRRDLIDYARYFCELALVDLYFVRILPSSVAYAALLNVLDMDDICTIRSLTEGQRKRFTDVLSDALHLSPHSVKVMASRERLRKIYDDVVSNHPEALDCDVEGGATRCLTPDTENDQIPGQPDHESGEGGGHKRKRGVADGSFSVSKATRTVSPPYTL